ncbi:hypothetical protein TNIN_349011 [Trichonephila inaurata madagascariensis]|uniref:Uncharacterized protein n=1 Tax=Trichonephila inaurata madagascariensis TaxID=2747483 RepID=A0A8X7C7S0_9ARAC|nr:hypothetical protein TNIN_349011 [Trichonephila inaurata madagascariensis]
MPIFRVVPIGPEAFLQPSDYKAYQITVYAKGREECASGRNESKNKNKKATHVIWPTRGPGPNGRFDVSVYGSPTSGMEVKGGPLELFLSGFLEKKVMGCWISMCRREMVTWDGV